MASIHSRRIYRYALDCGGLLLVLVVLAAFFGFFTEHFLSRTTLLTIANQIPDAVIIAVGMTFVLIIGGIDLSVGSVLALSGAVLGVCLVRLHLPLWASISIGATVGLACGVVNGLVTVLWTLPSFIVTLGMMEVARGGAYLVTSSQTLYIGESIEQVSNTTLFGLSLPFFLALGTVVSGQVILSGTGFGRYMLAVGANEETARLSGVSTKRVKLCVFLISGLLSSLAAVIYCSRVGASADPNAGAGFELQAIAAVVIGGTSLMGGRGSVINSFFGVLIMVVLETGLVQMGAQEPTKRLITGCVIVIAVIVDFYRHRLGAPRK